jgi:thioredoxin-related protein
VKNINKALPVLFMYFSPTCSDCGEMTSAILLHIKDLKNIQIVMITNESLIEVRKFIMYYGLYKYKNITVGTEGYTYEFLQNFQVGKLPFLVFYNNKDKLIMKYNGTIPAKNFILNVVKDCNY